MNIDKVFSFKKNRFCCWQDETIHAYKSLYLHCGPSTKVNRVAQILKYVEKNYDAYSYNRKTEKLI